MFNQFLFILFDEPALTELSLGLPKMSVFRRERSRHLPKPASASRGCGSCCAVAVLSTEPQKDRCEACALVPSGLKAVPLQTSSDITFTKDQNKVIKKRLLSQSKSTLSDVKKRWRVRIQV